MRDPESLTPASRLIIDSVRSPKMEPKKLRIPKAIALTTTRKISQMHIIFFKKMYTRISKIGTEIIHVHLKGNLKNKKEKGKEKGETFSTQYNRR
jgi:hypothetical protein